MRPIEICDLDDPRIAAYVDLRKARSATGRVSNTTAGSLPFVAETFIAEGRLVVDRLIRSDYAVQSIMVSQGSHPDLLQSVDGTFPVYALSRQMIGQVVGYDFHRGVLACGLRRKIPAASRLPANSIDTVSLALLGITEQENLGSIFRTAAAFGVQQIFLGSGTVDPLSRRTIRVSMGTAFGHQFIRLENEVDDLQRIANLGVRTIASTLADQTPSIRDFQRDQRPSMLLIGNEAKGIDPAVQALVTDRVQIPMSPDVDSLNASVAAAILIYELTK